MLIKELKATRIAEIAALANISQGLIHHYFICKEDVFTAVVERAMTGALAAFDDIAGLDSDPLERLTQITDRMLQGLVIHPEYMLVLTQSLVNQDTPPEVGKLLASLGQQVNTHLVRLIEAGQAAGKVVQGNPQELAMIFFATIQDWLSTISPRECSPSPHHLLTPTSSHLLRWSYAY